MASEQPPSSSSTTAAASSPSTPPIEYRVSYVLPEAFDCEKLENSFSIMFDAECIVKSKTHRIKGFTIRVTAENEADMLEQANIQAERLAQIMSLKNLGYVKYTYDGYSYKTSSGTWMVIKDLTLRYNIRPMVDELNLNSNQKISSIRQNDEETNIQLYHTRLAMEAEENRQFANMYRELFQVIEKERGLACYDKFKSLRDAVSHQKQLHSAPTKVKEYFEGRYDFRNGEFNHNSKKNREHLKEDADVLKKVVIAYLTGKLQ